MLDKVIKKVNVNFITEKSKQHWKHIFNNVFLKDGEYDYLYDNTKVEFIYSDAEDSIVFYSTTSNESGILD